MLVAPVLLIIGIIKDDYPLKFSFSTRWIDNSGKRRDVMSSMKVAREYTKQKKIATQKILHIRVSHKLSRIC